MKLISRNILVRLNNCLKETKTLASLDVPEEAHEITHLGFSKLFPDSS